LLRSVEKMYIGSDHIRPRRFHGGKDAMMNDIVQRERQVDGPLDKNVEVDNILNRGTNLCGSPGNPALREGRRRVQASPPPGGCVDALLTNCERRLG
jgi:hypothetical protein